MLQSLFRLFVRQVRQYLLTCLLYMHVCAFVYMFLRDCVYFLLYYVFVCVREYLHVWVCLLISMYTCVCMYFRGECMRVCVRDLRVHVRVHV